MNRPTVHATPSVALVGRKNVGKSSLFNRLIEKSKALVSDIPGTTRDVGIGTAVWRGQMLTVLDTGGLDIIKQDIIEINVRKQALRAAQKSHIILFICDAETGLLSTDLVLAKELRNVKRPVILVVNKADSPAIRRQIGDQWKKLGFGDPVAVSAATGTGTGDLLDRIYEELGKIDLPLENIEPESVLALIGRPNVGKSSILNAMVGEERVIVSEIAHTTREPNDTLLFYNDRPIMVVDTAGIRKHAKIGPGLENASVDKSLKAMKQADVVFLVIDAEAGVEAQDKHLAGLASESGKGIVIVVNKWDLVSEKNTKTGDQFTNELRKDLPFLWWAPVVFISAKTGQRVHQLLEMALEVRANRDKKITEDEMDKFVEEVVKPFVKERTPHHRDALGSRKKHPHVYGIRQTRTSPPSFTVIVKDKGVLDRSYLRFMENRIRERFNFDGTPVFVHAREIEK